MEFRKYRSPKIIRLQPSDAKTFVTIRRPSPKYRPMGVRLRTQLKKKNKEKEKLKNPGRSEIAQRYVTEKITSL